MSNIMKPDLVAFLAGTYALYNRTEIRDGKPVNSVAWGSGSIGIMTYTQSGYMSTTVASADSGLLPPDLNLTYPSQEGQSDADWAKAGKHTLSYAGPWSVQEAVPGVPATEESGQILHGPLTVAHIPALIAIFGGNGWISRGYHGISKSALGRDAFG
ncbi:hypothetical protein SAPIO_CDS6063 [Scedosporium apiospermum]|uniref:Lipocalin-like domain-containing protein n=1 Tax=Pseudallescheria apiosperma TaxID=563466 RepID=A0A084G4F2_PSEDA|nr:uncharacterized protein SAPIO_CDS6063 [Scedosporium apiospermum]KEZ42214.1 hypothetical protein SAPIO_CDS6063 [Scedosporium apiospermum]